MTSRSSPLFVPSWYLTVAQLEYQPTETPEFPVLSPHGPGHYRVRIHASGRDRHSDQVVEESGVRFNIIAWPATPIEAFIIKATSRHGYGLRKGQLEALPMLNPYPQL